MFQHDSQSIQHLMIAEKRAEEKVNQARKRKFYYALIYISKFYFNAEFVLQHKRVLSFC